MSDTHITPARGARQSNAQRKAANKEAVRASIPKPAKADIVARAVRQAAKEIEPQTPPAEVWCKVLKKGDGQISMGVHVAGVGDAHYERGDRLLLPVDTAAIYEDRAWVEIEDDPQV